ncbi:MAG TPA: prepilin-type N-terminal cleavage/methylation domain-containing protein [Candidatus Ozemobacteraceae bacterium]|jgi:prepilin-type N-terminal cleavage/methylation domain-containing protein
MRATRGFTLLEVLVTLLIMGLATTGILQLLTYGTREYEELTRGWRQREGISTLRRACRQAVMGGNIAGLTPAFAEALLTRTGSGLRSAGLIVRPQASGTWFIQPRLYDDRNGNGREDAGEPLPLTVWCFRDRGAAS